MNVSGKDPNAERQRSKTSGVPNDPRFDKIRETKKRVQSSLFKLPGVHAVGIGPKVVAGRRTGEPAIIAFVTEKKPLAQLKGSERIPSQFEGIKTDVVQVPKPRRTQDSASYRPLTGGIQIAIQKLGLAFGGTLGCIARTDEPTPRIVLLTCHHVVASEPFGEQTNLGINVNPTVTKLQLSGSNTPGTFVRALFQAKIGSNPDLQSFDVGYVTKPGDTLLEITLNLAGELNAKLNPIVTASGDAATFSISLTFDPSVNQRGLEAATYGPPAQDPAATIHAVISDPSLIQPPSIDFSGQVTSDVFVAVNLNLGGPEPTRGNIILAQKGDSPETIAQRVAGAVTSLNLQGVTATASGAKVTIDGAEEVECDFFDRRVGQPMPTFASAGCQCIDQSIGKVIDARLDIDAAVVELTPGLKYKAAIEGIGAVAGSYIVQLEDITDGTNSKLFPVRKRGYATLLQPGNITSLHVDGFIEGGGSQQHPAVVFNRFYTGAIQVQATGTEPPPGAPPGTPPVFSAEGDSGSAVVHTVQERNSRGELVDTHYIIGILFGGNPAVAATATTPAVPATTLVTPFDDIRDKMQIALEISENPNEVRTVPATAQNIVPANSQLAARPGIFGVLRSKIDAAETQISLTPNGEQLVCAVRNHATEAAVLINTNRRVATVWHRNRGPKILQAFLDALCSPKKPVPHEFEGKSLAECLRRIHCALARYGTKALGQEFALLADKLACFAGLTYPEMLAALERGGD